MQYTSISLFEITAYLSRAKKLSAKKPPVRETEFFVRKEHFLTYDGPS